MRELRNSFSEAECEAEFDRLFPNGLDSPDVRAEIAFDKIAWLLPDETVETSRDVIELVGRCVWDVFSNEHDVIAPDGHGPWDVLVEIGADRLSH
jgi:hypothetical protein